MHASSHVFFPRPLLPLFCATALLFAACSRPEAPAGRGAGGAPVPVQVAKAERRTLPLNYSSIGTVVAQRSVAVKSQVDGVIQLVHFREGDSVKKGERLLSLDKRPFQNALQIARADLINARAEATKAASDAERYEQLKQTDNVSKEQYNLFMTKRETTVAQVQAKEAAVANAELQLGYTEIVAPIDGRTGELNLHEGSLVKANDSGTPLLTINQITPIEVAFTTPEALIPAIRAASAEGPVAVRVLRRNTPQAKPVTGQLSFIDNAVDINTGTLLLKAEFNNADLSLWPGQFVDVETRLGAEKDALIVPIGAVQNGQQGSLIFVVKEDQTVELRSVKPGRSSEGVVIIPEGIREGETVVVDGQLRLIPGSRIVVRSLEEAARGGGAAPEGKPKGKPPGKPQGKPATESKP
jgi:multidrug efflux system membrane fusion protein